MQTKRDNRKEKNVLELVFLILFLYNFFSLWDHLTRGITKRIIEREWIYYSLFSHFCYIILALQHKSCIACYLSKSIQRETSLTITSQPTYDSFYLIDALGT